MLKATIRRWTFRTQYLQVDETSTETARRSRDAIIFQNSLLISNLESLRSAVNAHRAILENYLSMYIGAVAIVYLACVVCI